MSKNSESEQSEDFINKSMNEYQQDASILYEDERKPKHKGDKKAYTKDDALDQMKGKTSVVMQVLKIPMFLRIKLVSYLVNL